MYFIKRAKELQRCIDAKGMENASRLTARVRGSTVAGKKRGDGA